VDWTVVDQGCVIGQDAGIGSPDIDPDDSDSIVLIGRDSTVGPNVALLEGARLEPGSSAYHMPAAVRLSGQLDVEALASAGTRAIVAPAVATAAATAMAYLRFMVCTPGLSGSAGRMGVCGARLRKGCPKKHLLEASCKP
jgi:hypothetical protein